jgi:hypothetical protein
MGPRPRLTHPACAAVSAAKCAPGRNAPVALNDWRWPRTASFRVPLTRLRTIPTRRVGGIPRNGQSDSLGTFSSTALPLGGRSYVPICVGVPVPLDGLWSDCSGASCLVVGTGLGAGLTGWRWVSVGRPESLDARLNGWCWSFMPSFSTGALEGGPVVSTGRGRYLRGGDEVDVPSALSRFEACL